MAMKENENSNKKITRIFSITGMSCFSCVRKIESIINKKSGVIKVKVDLGSREAHITYNGLIVQENDFVSAIENQGYKVTKISQTRMPLKQNTDQAISIFFSTPLPYLKAVFASTAIIGFYLGLLTLTSDWYFARVQFEEYRIWILLLAAGLGIQVFLYSILRLHIRVVQIKGAGKSVAVSGGLSTAGMAACCAHYLVTVLPVLGVPFVTTAVASLERYQTQFFLVGVLSNIAGILFMLNLMRKNSILSVPEGFMKFGQNHKPI